MTKTKGELKFTYDNCLACGICVMECPINAIELSNTKVDAYKKAYPKLAGECIGCKKCEKACPFDAVQVC